MPIVTLPDRLGVATGAYGITRRNEPVFETEMLREGEAREAARRLSQAYRQALSRQSH
jgi:hypothetical protein